MVKTVVLMWLAWLSLSTQGASLTLEPGNSYKVTTQAEYVYADDESWDLETALTKGAWLPVDKNRINFGFVKAPVWVRFSVSLAQDSAQPSSPAPLALSQNPATTPYLTDSDWVVRISYPLLDYLDIYLLKEGALVSTSNVGDLVPFSQRPRPHAQFVHPMKLEPGSIYEIVLRVSTEGAAELPIIVEPAQKFETDNKLREFVRGFVNGIFAIMLLYNLIIYVFVRDKAYAFYVLNASVYLVQLSIFDGSGYQNFWPDHPDVNLYAFPFFNGLMQLTQFLFLVVFLDILRRNAWYVFPVKLVIAAMVPLPILGLLLDYQTIIPVQVLFAIFVNISGIVFGIYYSLKGEISARYFTLAWFLFLLGLLIVNLKSFGLVPNNVFTEYSYQIGAFIEMTLLSLALAQRIQSSQEEIISLQNENIETLGKYQNLYKNSLSGQFQIKSDGYIHSMNPAFVHMFGHDPNASLHVKELVVDPLDISRLLHALKRNEPIINDEIHLKTKSGESRWFNLSIRPVQEHNHELLNFDVSVIDIHERKENDSLKEQSLIDRMSTLEQLAVGICHEINTPLGVSVTAASYLKELNDNLNTSLKNGSLTKSEMENYIHEEQNLMTMVEGGLDRVDNLIREFRQVSVKQLGIKKEALSILEIITSAQNQVGAISDEKDFSFEIKCPDDLNYYGYCGALQMVLAELIENAFIHKSPSQNEVNISIHAVNHANTIEIDFSDNGEGIELDSPDELFNAFYTTKRGADGHLGLGLYKVHNLVTQLLKGSITYHQEASPHFAIRFPIHTDT